MYFFKRRSSGEGGEAAAASYCEGLRAEHCGGEGPEIRSVLPRVIKTGYKELNMINYFTSGHDEVCVCVCVCVVCVYARACVCRDWLASGLRVVWLDAARVPVRARWWSERARFLPLAQL